VALFWEHPEVTKLLLPWQQQELWVCSWALQWKMVVAIEGLLFSIFCCPIEGPCPAASPGGTPAPGLDPSAVALQAGPWRSSSGGTLAVHQGPGFPCHPCPQIPTSSRRRQRVPLLWARAGIAQPLGPWQLPGLTRGHPTGSARRVPCFEMTQINDASSFEKFSQVVDTPQI